MSKKEAAFEAEVCKFIAWLGGRHIKLNKPNWPDRLVVPTGYRPTFFIEFKREIDGAYGLTPKQKETIAWLRKWEHTVLVLDPNLMWKEKIKDLCV